MPEPFESLIIQYGKLAVFGTIGGVLLVYVLSVIAAWKLGLRRGWALACSGDEQDAEGADEAGEASADDSAAELPAEPAIGDDDATPIIAMAPVDDPGESSGPRRAISVPAGEPVGGARASEQTLKRMTADQIEAEAKLKPPRASEVAGNPLLPEGEVKIRCVACNKKMKASGPKFAKQRRCPFCKAEPFRYVTAV